MTMRPTSKTTIGVVLFALMLGSCEKKTTPAPERSQSGGQSTAPSAASEPRAAGAGVRVRKWRAL
jgi:hypothetical protein